MMPAVVVADVVLGFKLGAGVALLGLERPCLWLPAGSSVWWLELGARATYALDRELPAELDRERAGGYVWWAA